jgi:hypothetical protein
MSGRSDWLNSRACSFSDLVRLRLAMMCRNDTSFASVRFQGKLICMGARDVTGDKTKERPKKNWRRRAGGFAIAFAISLLIGRVFEFVGSEATLGAAARAQTGWMLSLSEASPWGVAKAYGAAYNDIVVQGMRRSYIDAGGEIQYTEPKGGLLGAFWAPLKAFFQTVIAFATTGGVVGLLQIAMGAMALALLNLRLSKGKRMTFGAPPIVNIMVLPVATIAAASLLAVALKLVMLGALVALSWVTQFAAGAAGATGVAGFCWYCAQKLGEKGAEHALTPKI